MGREKRKGKEVVVEKPARKRTRAEKEAERAEMVAKAAEEQASGRARPFQIREDPEAEAEAGVWAESEVLGPPEPRQQQQQRQFQMVLTQRQHSQRGRVLHSSRLREVPRQRQSVALDRGLGGGHQPQEPRRSAAAAAAARRAEALEAERAVFRMDTVVRLEPGVMLQNLTRANAAKVKRLR